MSSYSHLTVLFDTWFDYSLSLKLAHRADCPKKTHHLLRPVYSVYYIFIYKYMQKKREHLLSFLKWCRNSELNQGHRDFQSLALPTELLRHVPLSLLYLLKIFNQEVFNFLLRSQPNSNISAFYSRFLFNCNRIVGKVCYKFIC